jgi:hypothetical protein
LVLTTSVGWDVEAKTLAVNHVEVEQDCQLDYPQAYELVIVHWCNVHQVLYIQNVRVTGTS